MLGLIGKISLYVRLSSIKPASADLSNTEDGYDTEEAEMTSRIDYLEVI